MTPNNLQVALYKYVGTEWEKTNIEGTLFVYERKCEPVNGFLILNRLSSRNFIQPITKEVEIQDKSPFLLFKKEDIFGIWFFEETNCKTLFKIINQVIHKVKKEGVSEVQKTIKSNEQAGKQTAASTKSAASKNGEISLFDLLNNAGKKTETESMIPAKASPSGGEKLLRLLSCNESRPEELPKANGDGSVAAFFAQVSQAGPLPGFTPMPVVPKQAAVNNSLQSLLTDPAVMSLEKPMPPLPSKAKAASEIESNMKSANKGGNNNKKAPKKEQQQKKAGQQPENKENKNLNGGGGGISYASVAANTPNSASGVATNPAVESEPQLMSPMVFAGQDQTPKTPVSSLIQGPPPAMMIPPAPVFSPQLLNGGLQMAPPVVQPQLTPLTEAQLLQVEN